MNKRRKSREASVQRKRLKQNDDENEQEDVNRNEISNSMQDENLDCDSENIVVEKGVMSTEPKVKNSEQTSTGT